MRLQKYLAMQGIDSRRKCEEHIKAGRVKVNSKVITDMGFIIDPNVDTIHFDDRQVSEQQQKIYLMLNKPRGYITSLNDNFDRKIVLDLIYEKERVYPIGRLDYDTEGLLLLTNDGDFTYGLTHPKHHVPKTYMATIKGVPNKKDIFAFENGIIIEGSKTSKAEFEIIKEYKEKSVVKITIWEGRNRQIRKMCEAINHPIITLKRIRIGALGLGNLEVGDYRHLTDEEIQSLEVLI